MASRAEMLDSLTRRAEKPSQIGKRTIGRELCRLFFEHSCYPYPLPPCRRSGAYSPHAVNDFGAGVHLITNHVSVRLARERKGRKTA